ncbi:hypothetical protein RRG08_056677 [Elysia crispata]|uniref:Uncharacterized protein n=1 Tax=Elysia crispata TaxID=231223 RepID=A0AAE1CY09_9GAST|nr:hypothetical protein RRG08_056677 [Elysia crispata]
MSICISRHGNQRREDQAHDKQCGANHHQDYCQRKRTGTIISEDGSKTEILATAMARPKTIWKHRNIPLGIKVKLQRALVISVMLYACEPWTLNTDQQRRIQVVEMRRLRRLLGLPYKDHVTKNEVRRRVT